VEVQGTKSPACLGLPTFIGSSFQGQKSVHERRGRQRHLLVKKGGKIGERRTGAGHHGCHMQKKKDALELLETRVCREGGVEGSALKDQG